MEKCSERRSDGGLPHPEQDGILLKVVEPLAMKILVNDHAGHPFEVQLSRSLAKRGYQVLLHNCGNTLPMMPMFIEAGVQCYQSLQSIPEMELDSLKDDFGKNLTFWGGIAVEILIQGTPGEVRQNVRQAMERGAPGGGFILGPSHSVAHNVQYDNFMAMLDEYNRLKEAYG